MIPRFRMRCDALRTVCQQHEVQAMIVTNFTNVTYLSGFTGDDSYLIVHMNGQVLVSDFRYEIQLAEECPELELSIRKPGVGIVEDAARVLRAIGTTAVAVEGDSMTLSLMESFQETLPTIAFRPVRGAVERLRMVKDGEEIDVTREAIRVAQRAFDVMRASLTPEMTEIELSQMLESQMRKFGAQNASFPSIIAVGSNAALCHFQPGGRKIAESELLLVDWGARVKGYCSDLTRTLFTGRPTAEMEKIYNIVLEANQEAIAAVRGGVACHEVDAVARQIIEKAGYGEFFGHGLGHGLGLEIHENPRFARNFPGTVEPGMILTIEPGIYLPGKFGVRIEDDVLVTNDGCEVLTVTSPKTFESMIVK